MRHHNQSGSWQQLPLALNLNANLESMSVLRAAYSRLSLSRRFTFEQVMSDRALAIGIRHLADAIARRQASGNPAESTPTTNEIAEGTAPEFGLQPEINHSGTDIGDH
jgi:hypothetical protein